MGHKRLGILPQNNNYNHPSPTYQWKVQKGKQSFMPNILLGLLLSWHFFCSSWFRWCICLSLGTGVGLGRWPSREDSPFLFLTNLSWRVVALWVYTHLPWVPYLGQQCLILFSYCMPGWVVPVACQIMLACVSCNDPAIGCYVRHHLVDEVSPHRIGGSRLGKPMLPAEADCIIWQLAPLSHCSPWSTIGYSETEPCTSCPCVQIM